MTTTTDFLLEAQARANQTIDSLRNAENEIGGLNDTDLEDLIADLVEKAEDLEDQVAQFADRVEDFE